MNFVFYLHDEQSQEQFEQKLLWFKSRYNLVGIQDVEDCIYNGRKLSNVCHLTVDDGWRSTYEVIYPVMKKHGVPFSMFVSPHVLETGMNFWYYTMKFCDETELKQMLVDRGYYSRDAVRFPFELLAKEILIDDVYQLLDEYVTSHHLHIERGFCNLHELIEMKDSGLVEIGAHTMTHPILASVDAERSKNEITNSVLRLSELLNKEVRTFAYPNGLKNLDFGEREMTTVKKAGIKMAFSVDPGVVSRSVNPMAIPRVGSEKRLKLGRLGLWLPSVTNQAGVRAQILKCRL